MQKKKTWVGKRSNEGSLESKAASLVRADLGGGGVWMVFLEQIKRTQ